MSARGREATVTYANESEKPLVLSSAVVVDEAAQAAADDAFDYDFVGTSSVEINPISVADLPSTSFSFTELWNYDVVYWKTKNFVLAGVLIYFCEASKANRDTCLHPVWKDQRLTITRKARAKMCPGEDECSILDRFFCSLDLRADGASISDIRGQHFLQADFANQFLGGGALGCDH